MKQCPKCGANAADNAKFCIRCGFNIKKYEDESIYCPMCGTKVAGGSFCPECGHPLPTSAGNAVNVKADNASGIAEAPATEAVKESVAEAEVYNAVDKEENEKKKLLAPFKYSEQANGTYVIEGLADPSVTVIDIPEETTVIGKSAFEGTDVSVVTLPDGLLKIDDAAFKGCADLVYINLPKSLVYIGNEAFMDCPDLDITIPESVRKVGEDAISGTVNGLSYYMKKNCVKGNMIKFGSYNFDDENTKAPIEWRVIKVEDGKALLGSKYTLDYKKLNSWYYWEDNIASWLDGEFINTAFSSKERDFISTVEIIFKTGYDSSTNVATEHRKIFLPNDSIIRDADYYSYLNDTSITPYAKKICETKAICTCDIDTNWVSGSGWRPQGRVMLDTETGKSFTTVSNSFGIRPLLWVKLD